MELRFFDVPANPLESRRFLVGQERAYAAHGVRSATREPWVDAEPGAVTLVGAYDNAGELVGGMRIYFRSVLGRVPIEDYLGDPALNALLREWAHESPVEFSGLWVHPSRTGSGLSDFVILGSMAASRVQGARWACASGHHKVLTFYRKYGFSFDPSRPYTYPDERYTTYALYIDLTWAEAPNHPARDHYRDMLARFREGRAYRFTPEIARDWAPPLANATPWSQPILATG
jgi:hypothetical protein